MNSRKLKALRRRQARMDAERVAGWANLYERRAAEANAAGLLNEATYMAKKAAYWRARIQIVADPTYQAIKAGKAKRRNAAARTAEVKDAEA